MIVVTLSDCPARLRGDLTKWLIEINTGVYVGQVSARVRDELWDRICEHVKDGRATMVFSARNEQGLQFRVHNTTWEPVDFDGITLMRRPAREIREQQELSVSRAEQMRTARRSQPGRALPADNYVVIDLETTGLAAADEQIIELAAIRVRQGRIAEEYEQLVRVEGKIKPDIVQLTGIDDAMLETQGKPIRQALPEYMAFLGEDTIVAHHASFDISFLRAACKREGIPLPRSRIVDTLDIARKRMKGLSDLKLTTLAKTLDVPILTPHRALADCRVLQQIYVKLNEIR